MSENFYDKQTKDWQIIQGDTVNIPFQFVDSNKEDVDITAWEVKFTVRDPITREIIAALSKSHGKGGADDNDGIYYSIDTNTPVNLIPFLTKTNQVIIVLSYTDTGISTGVYSYDVAIFKDDNVTKWTPVKGNLIVREEVTLSV